VLYFARGNEATQLEYLTMTKTTSTDLVLPADFNGRPVLKAKTVEGGWVIIVEWTPEAQRVFKDGKGSEYAVAFVSHDQVRREMDAVGYAQWGYAHYITGWDAAVHHFDEDFLLD